MDDVIDRSRNLDFELNLTGVDILMCQLLGFVELQGIHQTLVARKGNCVSPLSWKLDDVLIQPDFRIGA